MLRWSVVLRLCYLSIALANYEVCCSFRSALLRIMTREGCKYKGYIEDLERDKPAKPTLAPSSSLLDFGLGNNSSTTGPSKFDAFTRKFKDTMVDLINADLSQPLPSSSSNSPYSTTPRQQMSPQPLQQQQQRQSPQQPPRAPAPEQMQQQQKAGQQQQQGAATGGAPSGGGPLGRPSAGMGNAATNAAGVHMTPRSASTAKLSCSRMAVCFNFVRRHDCNILSCFCCRSRT
jgi:hypothetical protein